MALLQDKVCIVTGAGKGFGRDIARAYYAQGAKLALITRSQADVDDLIAEFGENDKIFFFCGDVSDSGLVSQFVSQVVNKFGTIDVLVNNAGMRFRKGFLDISNDELNQVLDVNLKSVFTLCQEVLLHMIKNHEGKIINMSSIAGLMGGFGQTVYSAAKSGIIGFTKSLALEGARNNIRANCIAPSVVLTPAFEGIPPDYQKRMAERIPLKRLGDPREVGDLVVFLVSDMSSFITGQCIPITGGMDLFVF